VYVVAQKPIWVSWDKSEILIAYYILKDVLISGVNKLVYMVANKPQFRYVSYGRYRDSVLSTTISVFQELPAIVHSESRAGGLSCPVSCRTFPDPVPAATIERLK
jgi:hypothetical protein